MIHLPDVAGEKASNGSSDKNESTAECAEAAENRFEGIVASAISVISAVNYYERESALYGNWRRRLSLFVPTEFVPSMAVDSTGYHINYIFGDIGGVVPDPLQVA